MTNEKETTVGARRSEVPLTYKRVLVVTAHPDDPEFLFGATVAKLVREGAEVSYVICSNGSNGSKDPTTPDEEIIATRYAEQRAAATVLGVREVVFLGLSDGRLAPTYDLRRAIAREIRRVKPDLVLSHFPHRVLAIPVEASHPDHIAAGEATFSAILPDAANSRAVPELLQEGLEPHRVKEIWVPGYERTNYFVDATPFLEKKMEAILCHRSQLDSMESTAPPAWVYEWMRWSGARNDCEYAEEFERIKV
jgi:LmbE family N-acetylglucosaminyl deacetylase